MTFNIEKTNIQKKIARVDKRISSLNTHKTNIETAISELITANLNSDISIIPIITQYNNRIININNMIARITITKNQLEVQNNRIYSTDIKTKLNTLGSTGQSINVLFDKSEIKQSFFDKITIIENTNGLSQLTKNKTIQNLINNYQPENYV